MNITTRQQHRNQKVWLINCKAANFQKSQTAESIENDLYPLQSPHKLRSSLKPTRGTWLKLQQVEGQFVRFGGDKNQLPSHSRVSTVKQNKQVSSEGWEQKAEMDLMTSGAECDF